MSTALICHIPCEDWLKNSGAIDKKDVRISNHGILLNATSSNPPKLSLCDLDIKNWFPMAPYGILSNVR